MRLHSNVSVAANLAYYSCRPMNGLNVKAISHSRHAARFDICKGGINCTCHQYKLSCTYTVMTKPFDVSLQASSFPWHRFTLH
jgi:hypothetical protein